MWQSASNSQESASRGEASVARVREGCTTKGDATWGQRQKHWEPGWDPETGVDRDKNQQERGIIGGAALLPVDLSTVQDEWKKRRWHKKRLFSGLEPSD
ncbi:hypothetical protein SISSUDRAFT_1054916 [Sistotremastrum suecicum HHB10207 ss-3]|uniref:Uncharacterized protein n=1 Tax=Sistotremastrum suecicum HHB10207 ss-3 TaxID=1314776 RepID=A0A165Y616_9AGAM|nr:hypothetical protein SISSUDRAFT_1054916 [Sistotremastrum suecicum HHB10207 ss-3]